MHQLHLIFIKIYVTMNKFIGSIYQVPARRFKDLLVLLTFYSILSQILVLVNTG